MKNRSDCVIKSAASMGRGNVVETSVGFGKRGVMCFLFRYLGQLPAIVLVYNNSC